MAFIYETDNFEVIAFDKPHVSREEGGHIKIANKKGLTDRTKMSPKEAIEFMRLTMLMGEAMEIGMKNRGVQIIKVNYQDMGNWAYKKNEPYLLHVHIYGRVLGAINQPFPESVYLPDRKTGFYDNFKPLDEEDIKEIQNQIRILENTEKYLISNWNL